MARWTVSVGDDEFVIETADDGRVSLGIPSHKRLLATRHEIEDIRRKLGAAISDTTNGTS